MIGELVAEIVGQIIFEAILKPIAYVVKLVARGVYKVVRFPFALLAGVLLGAGGSEDASTREEGDHSAADAGGGPD
jgi:hypothetical protein